MKYFTKRQILEALDKLAKYNQFFGLTFLAAKKGQLPIGTIKHISLDALTKAFLSQYYVPDKRSKSFFRVFRFNNKRQFWLKPVYAGKGLQKLNTGTFKDAFIHEKNSTSWGWNKDYVKFLSTFLTKGDKISAFHLAVWLYRTREWPDEGSKNDVIKTFYSEFNITEEEKNFLFTDEIVSNIADDGIFQNVPVQWQEIASEYETPPDIGPEQGGILTYLEINGIGPVSPLRFDPGKRLNILTGDNGLGKTFLFDVAWWALTGDWAGRPAYPNRVSGVPLKGQIKFQITGATAGKPQTINYSPNQNLWSAPKNRATISGLIVYARVDGSFAVWDPATGGNILVFNREQVWDGKPGRIEGLIRDWTKWQDNPARYPFDIFKKVLARLSPPELGILVPGVPVRLLPDPREIPTIKHQYGEVPILFESAGVRRIIMLAYLIVWTWNEHKIKSEQTGKKSERRMVVMVDEIEAHLHPRWQRTILPALLGVSEDLSSELEMQLMVATHSPLVLASAESVFDPSLDKLFHLEMAQAGKVDFFEIPFIKYGPVDSWLTSQVFDLQQARSKEAEEIITRAIALQKLENPSSEEIKEVHNLLADILPPEDRFWPRWVFFASRHGVNV
jgi:hypothetical protein